MKKNKLFVGIQKNEKGSSLIFSLIIILILIAFSMAVLTMSVGNLKLSANSQESNHKASLQELIGQYYVSEIEKVLKTSEEEAQTYIRKNMFTLTGAEASALADNDALMTPALKAFLESGNQAYYNQEWVNKVQKPSTIPKVSHSGAYEDRVNNYMSSTLFKDYFADVFPYVYQYCAVKNLTKLSEDIDVNTHKERLKTFVGNQSALNSSANIDAYKMTKLTLVLHEAVGKYDQLAMNDIDIGLVKQGFSKATIDFTIDWETRRKLYASVKMITPTTESITQDSKRGLYANPIWTNTLTTNKGVIVTKGSQVVINGDLVSTGFIAEQESVVVNDANLKVFGNLNARGNVVLKQGNNASNGKSIEIHPYPNGLNVNSKKALYDNSEYYLKTQNRQAFGYDSKIGDNTFFKKGIGREIKTEGSLINDNALETQLPFILKDAGGGNVYARGLVIDSTVNNGAITVNGDTTFFDDIKNNGTSASKINLKGYVTGLDSLGIDISTFGSDETVKKHFDMDQSDDGSCIKNFNANYGNEININSPMVFVPGNAIVVDAKGNKYKTGTGVVDFTRHKDYLKPYQYLSEIGKEDTEANFDDRKKSFALSETEREDLGEAEATKKTYIEAKKVGEYLAENSVKSGISIKLTSNSKTSYINGTSLFKVGTDTSAQIGSNFMDVLNGSHVKTTYFNTSIPLMNEYRRVLGSAEIGDATLKNMYVYEYIYRVFKSKTQYLGLWDIKNIMNLVNKKVIIESTSNPQVFLPYDKIKFIALKAPETGPVVFDLATINQTVIENTPSGVIFADGDLKLTTSVNNVEFKGMIICNGTVTLDGNIKLTYDESVMKKVLQSSDLATEFFQPGETGLRLEEKDRKTSSARGKKIKAGERLEIVKWKLSK